MLFLACLFGLGGAGCAVSQPIYERVHYERNALRHEVDRARVESAERAAQIAALKVQLAKLSAERDLRLSDVTTEQADLLRRLDELAVLNDELSERLRLAGQGVEHLARERGSLSAALEEARLELEALRRRQTDAEARAAALEQLAARFQGMVDAGRAHVTTHKDRVLIDLPGDALFSPRGASLTRTGRATIVEIARLLRGMPNQRFEIAAHTDRLPRGRFESSWHLSADRAAAVAKLLVERGVPPQQLSATGRGEFAPVAPNATAEGRARNRRLEIAIVPGTEEGAKGSGTSGGAAVAAVAAAPWPG